MSFLNTRYSRIEYYDGNIDFKETTDIKVVVSANFKLIEVENGPLEETATGARKVNKN